MRTNVLDLGIAVATAIGIGGFMATPAFAGVSNHPTAQGTVTSGGSGGPGGGSGGSFGSNANGSFTQGGCGAGGFGGSGFHFSSSSGLVGGGSGGILCAR